ncbi:MAG: hypothetical protein ABSA71_14170 [Desulfomonilia bacterium]|jgi:hypothetical protein
MKILKIIIAGLSLILIIYACSSGHNTTGGVGWYPILTDVHMFNVNDSTNPVEESTFGVGDHVSFDIDAEDDDLNMKTFWVTEVSLTTTETTTLVSGPIAVALPGQNGQQIVSWTNIDPITILKPTGKFRMDFQIEDATGNKSYVVSITYTVK